MKITTYEKGAAIAVLVVVCTNPIFGTHILTWLEWTFAWVFKNGAWPNVIASGYILAYILFQIYKTNKAERKVTIPKHPKTSKAKYIENI